MGIQVDEPNMGPQTSKTQCVSTGSLKIDNIIDGLWGIPKGHITEIFGTSGSGKSSIALSCIRENPQERPILVDSEFKFDAQYASYMGINLKNIIILRSNILDDVKTFVEIVIESGSGLAIVDTISAIEHDTKKFNEVMMAMTELISKNVAIVLISQVRRHKSWPDDHPTLRLNSYFSHVSSFYPSLRIAVDRKSSKSYGNTWDDNLVTGSEISVSVVKNRFGKKDLETTTEIQYGIGINQSLEVLDEAFKRGFITRSGSWYFYRNLSLGEGRIKASTQLRSLPIYASLKDAVQRRESDRI